MAEDILGNEIHVGDRLAVAFRVSNEGAMRIGTVTGFGSRNEFWPGPKGYIHQPRPVMYVQYEKEFSFGHVRDTESKGYIYADLRRYVKIS